MKAEKHLDDLLKELHDRLKKIGFGQGPFTPKDFIASYLEAIGLKHSIEEAEAMREEREKEPYDGDAVRRAAAAAGWRRWWWRQAGSEAG